MCSLFHMAAFEMTHNRGGVTTIDLSLWEGFSPSLYPLVVKALSVAAITADGQIISNAEEPRGKSRLKEKKNFSTLM